MTTLGSKPNSELEAGLVARLRDAMCQRPSDDLALRGLRMHVHLIGRERRQITIDCTGPTAWVEPGHSGKAHAATRVEEHAFADFVAAGTFEEIIALFRDGSIRMIQGTCLQLMFFLRERPIGKRQPELRALVQAVLDADAQGKGTGFGNCALARDK